MTDEQQPVNDEEVANDQDKGVDTDALVTERDLYKETAQRLQADLENYRKRMVKQQTEAVERANEALVTKVLPVLDTMDLAKAHESNGSIEQVSSALLDVLAKEGLERINSVDQAFDPTLHEAVVHEAGDGEGGPKVVEEMRAGYTWKGRVIRPAMVKVAG